MFADSTNDQVITLPSTWKTKKKLTTSSSQTSSILSDDASVQTTSYASIEIQTDPPIIRHTIPTSMNFDNSTDELLPFLLGVGSMVSEQLKNNLKSRAFDGYDVIWEDESSSSLCQQTITNIEFNSQFSCLSLDWNCTGVVVGCCFGNHHHTSWCTHKGYVCFWNLQRQSLNVNKADTVVEFSSCTTCISCHPELPSISAIGTFNGEVVILDTSKTEGNETIASSNSGPRGHNDAITDIVWRQNIDNQQRTTYQIVTTSTDGFIIIWNFKRSQQLLSIHSRYLINSSNIPRSMRINKDANEEMGVTSLSFSHNDNNLFIIGTDSGNILKCNINDDDQKQGGDATATTTTTTTPVTFSFRRHDGPVYCVDCSNFHRNLFISSSTDTTIRIYSQLQASELISIESNNGYIFKIQWSKTRPLVFAIATSTGNVLVYDLKESQSQNVDILEGNKQGIPIFALKFNPKKPRILATGDEQGNIKIWQLSSKLAKQQTDEVSLLDEIARLALD